MKRAAFVAFAVVLAGCGGQGTLRVRAFETTWPHGGPGAGERFAVPGNVKAVALDGVTLRENEWTCWAEEPELAPAAAEYELHGSIVTVRLDNGLQARKLCRVTIVGRAPLRRAYDRGGFYQGDFVPVAIAYTG